MTTTTVVPARGDLATDTGDRWAWVVVWVLTAAVAVSWLPGLLGPLGDNHEGRIYGAVALQVSNLWELGWSASQWGTTRDPFAAAYSHHPPGFSLWYVPAWLLPGDLTTWVRVLPYLLGLSFLPASVAVLGRLGVRPLAAAAAVGLVAATPLYWVYGRIWPALGLVALLAWAVVDLRQRDVVPTRRLVAVCALAAVAVLANWFVMAAAALLGVWLLAGRGRDRVTVAVGATMAVAAVAAVGWVVAAPDTIEAGRQVAVRTTGGGFTAGEFVDRILRWTGELLPVWSVVALAGVVVALVDRRTRVVAAGASVLGVAWVVALPNGAYVHDYWIASLLVPMVVALAVLVDRLMVVRPVVVGAVAVALAGGALAVLLAGDVPEERIAAPAAAGALAASVPPPDQPTGWVTRFVAGPVWLGYAWDMPVEILRDRDDLGAVAGDDLVLVNLDRLPPWVASAEALVADAVARERGYVLVTGDTLAGASR